MIPGWDASAVALVAWAAVVAAVDWRQRKVPNLLLLVALLPAGAVLVWSGKGPLGIGWAGSLAGTLLGLILLLPGYFKSKLGAGDVKLAAVFGFLQGPAELLYTLVFAALFLGAMSMLAVVSLGSAKALTSPRLPAAVALGSGFAVALLFSSWGNG